MKYEIILKAKEVSRMNFQTKFRVVVDSEQRMEVVKLQYERIADRRTSGKTADWFDAIVLVNKLDDNGNFIETIQ